MESDEQYSDPQADTGRSPYDADPVPDEDLWFLPGPAMDDAAGDLPWPQATPEARLDVAAWRRAEATQYKALTQAAEAMARFAERLRAAPDGAADRLALASVSALLRAEGHWLSPERIALFRHLRLSTGDEGRELARAIWALSRLGASGQGAAPLGGLRGFLGRSPVADPQTPVNDDRPVGAELELVSAQWLERMSGIGDLHPLTRGAYGFASWRAEGVTGWDDMLEPSVAAMLIGAGPAPFVPMSHGHRLDRHATRTGPEGVAARLRQFYGAAEAGALDGLMQLDRLAAWNAKARAAISDLSGRTPPVLIGALLALPVLSAELAAERAGCSRATALRNLTLFARRGLIRETTGQDRYRFWTTCQ